MPRLLARLAAPVLALALAACGGGGGGGGGGGPVGEPPPPPPPPSQQEIDLAREVIDLVNVERVSRGLDPLTEDLVAAAAAYGHAYDMDARSFFDHENPSGETPGDRATRAGVSWSTLGENIARGQTTPEEVMSDWMGSPGHRANILGEEFTRIGVGVHLAPGGPWWVQLFAGP